MVTGILSTTWLLFPAFISLHALPAEVNKETPNEEVPTNGEIKLTEEESKSLTDLTAVEKIAKFSPAQVDDKNDGGEVHKHFGECEEIAVKQLDVPWSTQKKCLKMLWAEAKKEQKSLKVLELRVDFTC